MDYKLLEKYWKGKCSAEETEKAEEFLRDNRSEADVLLRKEWDHAPGPISGKDSQSIREAVFAFVKEDTGKVRRLSASGFKKSLMVAASLLLLLAVGSVAYFMYQPANGQWIVVDNARDTAREIELADGTRIWLKPGSSISYSNEFGEQERNIKLVGEAYFDVAKDSLKPFQVRTDNITTRVLGTMFNIKAYEFEENIQIVLTEGSVSVTFKDEETEREIAKMHPGELLNFDKVNNNTSVDAIRNSGEELYKGNKLVFYNTTVREALIRISRTYGLEIDMNALSATDMEKHVSGVFHNTTPVDAIQRILFIHHMVLEQKDGKLLVKRNN
ncbi:FecR family protein [Sinomicrobium sp. M5D2P17]